MKRFILFLAAALMVSTVLAGFKYEGEWGKHGTGNGQFMELYSVDVAPNGNVYVNESGRIQYFTATGSYLGKWNSGEDVAVAPNGNVYSGGCDGYMYYTASGSRRGSWYPQYGLKPGSHGDIGPGGIVFGPEYDGQAKILYVARYKPKGAPVGPWPTKYGREYGASIGVSPDGKRVYVAPRRQPRISVYTYSGSFLRGWGSSGSANGQFREVTDLAVDPDGRVFATDHWNHRVQFFTPTGSFLGKWGRLGSGPGEFNEPVAIAVSPDGKRVYVADEGNYRIQYFNRNEPAVSPTSLGRVKALFR